MPSPYCSTTPISSRSTGKLDDEGTEKLKKAVEEFKAHFAEQVGTVETAAAEEGVPEATETAAADEGSEAPASDEEAEGA